MRIMAFNCYVRPVYDCLQQYTDSLSHDFIKQKRNKQTNKKEWQQQVLGTQQVYGTSTVYQAL